MEESEKMKIDKVGEQYIIKNINYLTHRKCKCKNYGAKILGFDQDYDFKREFLKKVRFGREKTSYALIEKPKAGDVFEISAQQWSWTGKTIVSESKGFYKLNTDGTFLEIKKEEVNAIFPAPPKTAENPLNETF